ncbi:hypothetical protein EPI10_027894 [Gossypium australe]|uniref:Uncharacterized protein n=1 Tax=Gossypium australe TaxID=47621 RepID=A0A5B6UVL0_9ROSI|nr:hypothetical protein EPI10_027894 [Gossypium australe]
MPRYTKKRPRDGMTNVYNLGNLEKAKWSCYSLGNSNLDGSDHSSFIKSIPMEWWKYRMIREVHLKLTVNVLNTIGIIKLSKLIPRSI